jgi:hypothetical protein
MPQQFYCDSLPKPLSRRKITLFVGVNKKEKKKLFGVPYTAFFLQKLNLLIFLHL